MRRVQGYFGEVRFQECFHGCGGPCRNLQLAVELSSCLCCFYQLARDVVLAIYFLRILADIEPVIKFLCLASCMTNRCQTTFTSFVYAGVCGGKV